MGSFLTYSRPDRLHQGPSRGSAGPKANTDVRSCVDSMHTAIVIIHS